MTRIAAVILSLLCSTGAFAAPVAQRYLVATRSSVAPVRIGTMIRDIEAGPRPQQSRNVVAFESVNGFAADLTADEAAALSVSSGVLYVEPAVERRAFGLSGAKRGDGDVVNPFAQSVPYGVDLIRAREVWPVTRGQGINVVVVDSGIDFTHPELSAVYAGGLNTYDASAPPMDDNNHGTHVAGTIAAADNGWGVVGVAPGVRLWAVKVLNSAGSGSSDRLITAIDWVINKKATLGGNWIMNFSLGSAQPSGLERVAFGRAIDAGILVCAASGNESTSAAPAAVAYPAGYSNVLAVGAVDAAREVASFSNQGPQLAFVGPGVNVLSTVPVGKGTSAGVQSSIGSFLASEIELSRKGTVTADFVDCGLGNPSEFPAAVAGRIAVIKRGSLTFNAKTHNAVNAGAVAVIIYNNDGSATNFTLKSDADPGAATFNWPVTIALSLADGQKLLASARGPITMVNKADDYDIFSGTSMATPHASAVAALAWSAAQTATASQVAQALKSTAVDLGTPGFDNVFGFGLLDATSAAKTLAPASFGSGGSPPPVPTSKQRAVRGH